MSPLTEALDLIESWLVRNQPEIALGLQPGLTRIEIDEIVKEFSSSLPEELYEFYGWHNGCTSFGCVIPFYDNFSSLQKSVKRSLDYLEWGDSEWNPHWLVILDCNGDEQYAIVVGEETAPVWYIYQENGIEEIRWGNLTDLMLATAECYYTGAYYLNQDGDLEKDPQKVAEIQHRYNYRGAERPIVDASYPYPSTVAGQVDLSNSDALEQLTQALQARPLSSDASILQAMAAKTIENLANLNLSEAMGFQPLMRALQNLISDGAGHALAAQKLGELGDSRAVEPLLQALHDRSSEVRANAIEALGKLGDRRAVEPLIQCLQDSDFFARTRAAWALAELRDVRAFEPLLQRLETENDTAPCAAIVSALGKFGDTRAIDSLIAILRSEGQNLRDSFGFKHVRLSLVEALGLIEDPRTTDVLVEILRDRESILHHKGAWDLPHKTTQCAVETLLQRQYSGLTEILIELLQDSERQIRCTTLLALTHIPDTQMVDLLLLGLSDEDAWLRRAAIQSLGERQDSRAIHPLIQTLQDANVDTRLEAIQALENFRDLSVVEAVITMLSDENSNVRCGAALALGNLGDQRAMEPLRRCLEDESSIVRKMAQEALNKLS